MTADASSRELKGEENMRQWEIKWVRHRRCDDHQSILTLSYR